MSGKVGFEVHLPTVAMWDSVLAILSGQFHFLSEFQLDTNTELGVGQVPDCLC